METYKRISIRFEENLPIFYAPIDQRDFRKATLVNDSDNGMLIEAKNPLNIQTPLIVKIDHPEKVPLSNEDYLSRIGKVKWCRKIAKKPGAYGIGLQYTAKAMAVKIEAEKEPLKQCDMCEERLRIQAYLTNESLWLCSGCFRFMGTWLEGKLKESVIRFVAGNVI